MSDVADAADRADAPESRPPKKSSEPQESERSIVLKRHKEGDGDDSSAPTEPALNPVGKDPDDADD